MPIISNIGWAIISLSFFAGAFNVEIFRAGIEAVPESTREAADSLGMNSLQIYGYVVLPLAFRVSLPSLNNNLVNLVKTTTQAMAIAVPELLYEMVSPSTTTIRPPRTLRCWCCSCPTLSWSAFS